MEVNKNKTPILINSASYNVEDLFGQSPYPICLADDMDNAQMPPPYSDEPPAYSAVVASSGLSYLSTPPANLDCMSKLPYGDPNNNSSYSPPPPPQPQGQNYGLEHVHPQPDFQQLSDEETFDHETLETTPQANHANSSSNVLQLKQQLPSSSITLHKDLLQPTSSRIVETKIKRHGKTKSHVKDLETGKEYFIKQKISRSGQRSKAVVKEVGGPKTVVLETPKKTIVCQKKK